MIFSMTVIWPKRLKDWKTMPMRCRTRFTLQRRSVISSSPTQIFPAVGFSSRLMQRRSVLLPVPDGPMTAITSPSRISAVTSFRGVTSGYSFFRCSILIIGLHPFQNT